MKDYYRTLRRQPNFGHPVRVSIVMQTPHKFLPLPGMSADQIARGKALEVSGKPDYDDHVDETGRKAGEV